VPAADSVFASFPVQQQLGVSLAKMDFLLEILLICFQATKKSGLITIACAIQLKPRPFDL
jgi:hypothetical protein